MTVYAPRVSDPFDRADAVLNTAGWVALGGSTGAMQIISDTVWGSAEPSGSLFTGTTFNNDQWAQCTLKTLNSSSADSGIGVIVRGTTSARTCYVAIGNNNSQVFVGKYVAGVYTNLATIATGALSNTKLRLEVSGTTLRCYLNGSQIGSDISDSSIASGSPGLARKDSSNNNVDNFHAGDLTTTLIAISATAVDGSAGNGSTSVTVPSDATGVAAFWAHYDGNGNTSLSGLTLGGASFTTLTQLNEGATTDESGTGVAVLANPSVGSQTVAWTWSAGGARQEGGGIVLAFFKGINTADYVVDSDADANSGGGIPNVDLTASAGNMIFAFHQTFGADPAIADPADVLYTGTVNQEHYQLGVYGADHDGTGDGVRRLDSADYSTIVELAIKEGVTSTVQAIRPDADITTTGWTSTPLFSKINETSPDGTVITATAS